MQPVIDQSHLLPSPMLDGFESFSANAESSTSRRQRISMACQYCRHRCCGGAPCRNCTRSSRECEYAPVPEEVNRATREKKAIAKSSKPTPSPSMLHSAAFATSSPMTAAGAYSPYFLDVPTVDGHYAHHTATGLGHSDASPAHPGRPAHLSHRRSSSTPNYPSAPWTQPPPAPLLNSPAQLESSAWMYNNWSSAPPVPTVVEPSTAPAPYTPAGAFPSVLEQTPVHTAYLATQHTRTMSQPHQIYSTPMASVPHMPPAMPITPPESRAGSMEATFTSPYVTSQPSMPSAYPMSMPYVAPVAPAPDPGPYFAPASATTTNFKGLTVQTPSQPMVSVSAPTGYPYSPPISPNAYYTPYATPSMYSSSAQTTMYTPSPPAISISPTLAPEPTSQKEELVGLGLGMGGMNLGLGMGMGGMAQPGGLGVQVIEQDVFYTPNMGTEAYFTYQ